MSQEHSQLDVAVSDNPEQSRFEAHIDGELAGFLEYVAAPGQVRATHTQVFESWEGRGVGSRLVAGSLDMLRADDRRVEAQCPYVIAFLRRHPEYTDLVTNPEQE